MYGPLQPITNDNNFIVGQQDNTDAVLNMTGDPLIDLTAAFANNPAHGDVNLNAGQGTINMAGGTILAQDLNLSNNNNAGIGMPATADLNISGGVIDLGGGVNYRGNGDDEVTLSGMASLLVTANFQMDNPAAAGELNILEIAGSERTVAEVIKGAVIGSD